MNTKQQPVAADLTAHARAAGAVVFDKDGQYGNYQAGGVLFTPAEWSVFCDRLLAALGSAPATPVPAARVKRRHIAAGHGTPDTTTYDVEWLTVDPFKWTGDLYATPVQPVPASEPVYLVATGEVVDGQETYTRHEGAPPPMCDFERLDAAPTAPASAPATQDKAP